MDNFPSNIASFSNFARFLNVLDALKKQYPYVSNIFSSALLTICTEYEMLAEAEKLIVDANGIVDLNFKYNDQSSWPFSALTSQVPVSMSSFFSELSQAISNANEHKFYEQLSEAEVRGILDVLDVLAKYDESIDCFAKNYMYFRISSRLKEYRNDEHFNPNQRLLVDSFFAAVEVERLNLQKKYIEDEISDEHASSKAKCHLINLKYISLSSRSSYLERLALNSKFDISSIMVISPEEARKLLESKKDDKEVCEYLVDYVITDIKKYVLLQSFNSTTMYQVATKCIFITALINCLPAFLLDMLSSRITSDFPENQSLNWLITHIANCLKLYNHGK